MPVVVRPVLELVAALVGGGIVLGGLGLELICEGEGGEGDRGAKGLALLVKNRQDE